MQQSTDPCTGNDVSFGTTCAHCITVLYSKSFAHGYIPGQSPNRLRLVSSLTFWDDAKGKPINHYLFDVTLLLADEAAVHG